jgi:hypothetical protein
MPVYTAAVIESWPTPNYVDPETRGDSLYYLNSTFLILATTAVAFRLYTRIWIRNWFGLDDAFVLISLVRTHHLTQTLPLGRVCVWRTSSESARLRKLAGRLVVRRKLSQNFLASRVVNMVLNTR